MEWVSYPGHYGLFHTFSDEPDGPWRLCGCTRQALANLWEIARVEGTGGQPIGAYIGLPENLPRSSPWAYLDDPDEVDALFGEALCHRCNVVTPTLRWAHEMYEGQFNQFHGWYTQQAAARAGFRKFSSVHASSTAPELVAAYEASQPDAEYSARIARIVHGDAPIGSLSMDEQMVRRAIPEVRAEIDRLAKPLGAARRKWDNLFQDEARAEFGYRNVGDGFVSESQLQALIRQYVAGLAGIDSFEVTRHMRPDWLKGLELDIYLPAAEVAFEYQGQQHYKAIDAWGGQEALERLQERDARKRVLCQQQGVALVEVAHTEPLTLAHLTARLASAPASGGRTVADLLHAVYVRE
jgi:hypothetical protein